MQADAQGQGADPSRRWFLKTAGGVAAGSVVGQGALAANGSAFGTLEAERLSGTVELELTINGRTSKVTCEPRTTLLNALRNHCAPPLTGAKPVCELGQCGACTVWVDDQPAYACLLLAADCVGREVTTIEGLSSGDELTPLQAAFVERDALMCGFCTPGFVMSIESTLRKKPGASLDEIKGGCSGNVCRCGTYPHIFQAALDAQAAKGKAR
jgi:aerobic-type carbon monoxide dehydrogenase small subunit (CoxS/CutS family)